MSFGDRRPLHLRSFDHRHSHVNRGSRVTPAEYTQVPDGEEIIDGCFKETPAHGVTGHADVLDDEGFGAATS